MFALECSEFLSEVCWGDLQKTEEITFVCVKIDKSLESSSKHTEVSYGGEITPDDIALQQCSEQRIRKRTIFSFATRPVSAPGLYQHC